jgi:hypothetical protein
MAWNQNTGKWEAPQPPRKSSLTNAIAWDDGDGDGDFGMDDGILTADYCTPSRHRSLTAQPQARPRAITYAQYDPAFDVDLHPELDVPVPPPAKPERAPVPVPPPAPDPDAPIPAPWWPVRERQEARRDTTLG